MNEDQLRLPFQLARNTDPPESHEAAEAVHADLGRRRQWVLDLVRSKPGRTARELCEECGVSDIRDVNRRLPELEEQGRVHRKPGKCWITNRSAARWFPGKEGE